jgi:hypothetical protein
MIDLLATPVELRTKEEMMDGRELAQAWNKWQESPDGERCQSDSPSGEWLQNRLWRAFMAGAKAVEDSNAKS